MCGSRFLELGLCALLASSCLTGPDADPNTGAAWVGALGQRKDPPGLGAVTGEQFRDVDCSVHGVRTVPESLAEGVPLIVGMWKRCSTQQTNAAANLLPFSAELIEFHDTDWHLLEKQADGSLTRRQDLDGSGKLEITYDYEKVHMKLYTTAGSFNPGFPNFETSPDWMRITYYPAEVIEFRRMH